MELKPDLADESCLAPAHSEGATLKWNESSDATADLYVDESRVQPHDGPWEECKVDPGHPERGGTPTCVTGLVACPEETKSTEGSKSVKAERTYKCAVCEKVFRCKSELNRHIATVHEKRADFQCEFCLRNFTTKQLSLIHI